ncbi:MAG TPA: DUF4157 domain-containing protein [Pyrinomonadaceae bacterium]|nr:DUF4157 domain-containing protein [Pyrinomonadaceae bacterium]
MTRNSAGAGGRPRAMTAAATLLGLQRSHGNRFLRRRLAGLGVQPKCACGEGGATTCAGCAARQEETIRRRAAREVGDAQMMSEAAPVVEEVLGSPGQPLDGQAREFMESRFGHDFSGVRVHTDSRAAESARAVGALAYTVGQDVVFDEGQYQPRTREGRRLLAHELTHVVQQSGAAVSKSSPSEVSSPADASEQEAERVAEQVSADAAPRPAPPVSVARYGGLPRLSRASFNVGSVTVNVDYGNVVHIPASDYVNEIEARFAAWTGSPAATIHAALTALTTAQQRWVLLALDLLVDNTTAAHGALNRVQAMQRVIARAPASTTPPLGVANFDFENEVLRVSGWFEVALTAGLTAPTGATLTNLTSLYNPPPGPSAPAAGVLDVAGLHADLPPALTTLLTARDPANWAATGTQAIGTIQAIGDEIQAEARGFFAPYADTAISNVYSSNWAYSTNIYSVTATVPTRDQRLGYLLNRAEIVGRRSQPGGSIFSNVNFDSGRAADRAELLNIATTLEANATIAAIVDRLLQHTGRTDRATNTVGISTEFNLGVMNECEARWGTIDTLTHELVHVLVHPSFPPRAGSIGFGQIVREGFTEVLGVQLYEHVRSKAGTDAAFKARMEAGISAAPCPTPAAATIGYGQAGTDAESIRTQVGDNNFRAAYFLGALNLVGL